jgi:hypothetical protein
VRAYRVSDDKHADRHRPGGADPLTITDFGGAPLDALWKPDTDYVIGQLVISEDSVAYVATSAFTSGVTFDESNLVRVGTTGSTVTMVAGMPPDGTGNVPLGTAATYDVGTNEGDLVLLTVGGKLPTSSIPALAINDVFTAASEAEMLALAAQQGDMALRTDVDPNEIYILKASPASTLGNWILLSTPSAVTSVNGQQGVIVLGAVDVGAVPTGRTVNGKPLSADITLDAADVGALPDTTTAVDVGALPDTTTAGDIGGIVSSNGTVVSAIKLAVSDAIPAGTPAGTLIWRADS